MQAAQSPTINFAEVHSITWLRDLRSQSVARITKHQPYPSLARHHESCGSNDKSLRMVPPIAAVIPCLFLRRRWQPHRRSKALRQALVKEDIDCVQGTLTYQDDSVERSLKYDGVGSHNGAALGGSMYSKKTVTITNGRGRSLDLDNDGFMLVQDTTEIIDFYNEMAICKQYYPACCKLVQKVTGASKVFAFYHTVRSHDSVAGARKRISKGFPVEKPAACVHVDYSEACAMRQVRTLTKAPHQWPDPRPLLGFQPLLSVAEAEEYIQGKKRWAIMNVWRNLSSEPVQRTPVTLCRGTSASLDDLITFRAQVGRYNSKEYYFSAHSKDHEWFYFPEAQRDEAIIIKNWDSAGEWFARKNCKETVPATFALHTAFEDPNTVPNAPFRESMEVRMVVLF